MKVEDWTIKSDTVNSGSKLELVISCADYENPFNLLNKIKALNSEDLSVVTGEGKDNQSIPKDYNHNGTTYPYGEYHYPYNDDKSTLKVDSRRNKDYWTEIQLC